jgi:hypothetical protein
MFPAPGAIHFTPSAKQVHRRFDPNAMSRHFLFIVRHVTSAE